MEDLSIGSEIVLKVVESEKEECVERINLEKERVDYDRR